MRQFHQLRHALAVGALILALERLRPALPLK